MLFGDDDDTLIGGEGEDQDDDNEVAEGDEGPDDEADETEGDEEDEGAEGDEAAEGAEGDEGRDADGAQRRTRRSPQDTIRALRKRARDAEAERDRIRSEAATAPRPSNQQDPAVRAAAEAAERERVALMDPDQKLDYYRQKDRTEFAQAFGSLQFQMADNSDRTLFSTLASSDPAIQAVAKEVEIELANLRRAGTNLPREAIANFLIGKKARERAGRAKPKQKRKGEERLSANRSRSTRSRSDVGGEGGRTTDQAARRKRLENMEI